jgi:ACS family hexuronate transporter-like MFS transporter
MMPKIPGRWVAVSVFVLSSTLNYFDRLLLAALAPLLLAEFRMTQEDYGTVLMVFAITYAVSSPAAGMLIDRFGLNRGISAAVGLWSVASIATGFVGGMRSLIACRALLGVAEAGGVPAAGKLTHAYLLPPERALGAALSQIGLSIGSIIAPPLGTFLALRYGWRAAFIFAGVLGFAWIPLWLATSRRIPGTFEKEHVRPKRPAGDLLRDIRMWGFVAASFLAMPAYTLWTNWTTLYLQRMHGASLVEANSLAGLPHFFGYFGGLAGGWLSMHWMNRGMPALPARRRACLVCATALLSTGLVPLMPTAGTAVIGMSMSFFAASAWSVNLYTMPIDAFGGSRAAFATSLLTSVYGLLQAVTSRGIGRVADECGYAPVCFLFSVLPLAGYGILRLTARESDQTEA